MVKVLDSQSMDPRLETSEGWLNLHFFEVNEMSTRYSWGLKVKSKLPSHSGCILWILSIKNDHFLVKKFFLKHLSTVLAMTLVNNKKYSHCIHETLRKWDILQKNFQKSSEKLNLFFVFEPNLKKCQELLLRLPNMFRRFFILWSITWQFLIT